MHFAASYFVFTFFGYDGEVLFKTFPRLCRGEGKDWPSLLGAVLVDDLDFGKLLGIESRFKYVIVSGDAHGSNFALVKALIVMYAHLQYLLFLYSSCFAHILSKATEKSLCIDFGAYMSIAHCLDGRPFGDYKSWIRSQVTCSQEEAPKSMQSGIWLEFLRRLYNRDPFSEAEFSDEITSLSESMSRIFPFGIPCRNEKWKICISGSNVGMCSSLCDA